MSGDEVVGHERPDRGAIVAAVAVVIDDTATLSGHHLPSPRPAVT